MAICSSILAWEIPWTVEPGGLQSMGFQIAGHNHQLSTCTLKCLLLCYSHNKKLTHFPVLSYVS